MDMEKENEYSGADHAVRDLLLIMGGALIGAAVALLYAPQSGERTRRQLLRKYEDVKDQALELCDDMVSKVEDLRQGVARQIEAGKDFVGDKKDELLASLSDLEKNLSGLSKKLGRD